MLCSLNKLKELACVLFLLCVALVISLLMRQTKTLASSAAQGGGGSFKDRTL